MKIKDKSPPERLADKNSDNIILLFSRAGKKIKVKKHCQLLMLFAN
jgi:hypothetical protein